MENLQVQFMQITVTVVLEVSNMSHLYFWSCFSGNILLTNKHPLTMPPVE